MMKSNTNQKRLERIYQMLFEMAAGNFTFKIQSSGIDDELEGLILLVNMVAEELRAAVFQNGFVTTHFSYQYLVQHTFILDHNFLIKSFSPDVITNFGYAEEHLVNKAFVIFLSDISIQKWNLSSDAITSDPSYHETFQLTFKTESGLLKPCFCIISRLLHSNRILVSTVSIAMQDALLVNPLLLNVNASETRSSIAPNSRLVKKLYDFILENLNSPLPTLRALSTQFGTNENKLKDGFRHFFKTSIYQFYNDERLKRAHLLIQQSNLSLQEIAYMSGFNLYSNFSKSFKKRFGYAPNTVRRQNHDDSVH